MQKIKQVYRFYVQTASEDLLVYKTSVSPDADTTSPDGRNDVFRFPEIDIASTTSISGNANAASSGTPNGTNAGGSPKQGSTTADGATTGNNGVPNIELPRDHASATQCLMGTVLDSFLRNELLGMVERKEIDSLTLEGSFLEDGCDCGSSFGGRMKKVGKFQW